MGNPATRIDPRQMKRLLLANGGLPNRAATTAGTAVRIEQVADEVVFTRHDGEAGWRLACPRLDPVIAETRPDPSLVNVTRLMSIARLIEADGDEILISQEADGGATFRQSDRWYTLEKEPTSVSDLIPFPEYHGGPNVRIARAERYQLAHGLKAVLPFADKSGNPPGLSHVLVVVENDRLILVATDRYRLAAQWLSQPRLNLEVGNGEGSLVPASWLKGVMHALNRDDLFSEVLVDGLTMAADDIHFWVTFADHPSGGMTMVTRKMAPTSFPKWKQLLPEDSQLEERSRIRVHNAAQLAGALNLATPESGEPIVLTVVDNGVTVHWGADDNSSGIRLDDYVSMSTATDTMVLKIGVNRDFLTDLLKSFGNVPVDMFVLDPQKPIVVTSEYSFGLRTLIMPTRLTDRS